ncbi:MAG: glycosyltransferase family 2 protein, partial [Treponema sp.]|nr:glycosyltransferase family 2 protein [Treponema sp.]
KKLFIEHIKAIVYYFNKWGWFFDKERKLINKNTINNLKK